MTTSHMTLRRAAAFVLAGALLATALPAQALEGPTHGKKQRDRHTFRDVQLGLSHPSTHGMSTQTSAPPKPLFPWLPTPADPGAAVQGGGLR
ncbi:hypothetical protein [Aquabacter cavernae]|uniref:hypothetical protein n=1 Tax=Aquabacter cavernae TaxID=2496029 RepID=UPI000F8EA92F|nr:hypothetical protein [Aquabacter cavernae]